MIIAHLDCSSGVSGDKFLGALLDAGAQTDSLDLEAVILNLIQHLDLDLNFDVNTTSTHGITAKTVKVSEANPPTRSWKDIKTLITSLPSSVLSDNARDAALLVFEHIAVVEARIHGTSIDDVHFHEIGAADSIIDILGVCVAMDALRIEKLYATPPALGSGTVDTQHGTLPVPAPATAELLRGMPTAMSSAQGELTTPTGAALLKLASGFGPVPPMTPESIGYGAGTRDIGQPNICRLLVGQLDHDAMEKMTLAAQSGGSLLTREETVLLETNIDHIAPEAVAFAGEQLLAEGALDVWVTPIAMKKSRAALTLSVLAAAEEAETFAARMMKLTGTLGVRCSIQPRYIADRESVEVDTPWGPVSVKIGSGRVRPEHEDVARIAREHDLEYSEVLKTIAAVSTKE